MNMIVCVWGCGIYFTQGPFSLSLGVERVCGELCDKVYRESKEVHWENRMICSARGLYIDLVYFFLTVIFQGVGILTLISFFFI